MNQPQLISSSNTFPSMPAPRLHIPSKKTQTNLSAILQTSQANPLATSSKIRYPSPSRGSRIDERLYKRVSMEEEPNGHRPQSISVQEREIGSTRNNDFEEEKEAKLENRWATLNNGLQATQSSNLTVNAKLLASLEEAKMADIEKKFFVQGHCLLCGKNVSRNFKAHVRIHIEGRKHIKSYYSFCLDEDDKTLQIKCDKCPRIFNQLTVEKLREHSQACNATDISSNNKLGSIINNGSERLDKLEEKLEGEFKALQEQITSIKARLDKNDAKVNEVSKSQETMKEKLDSTDNKMTTFEQKIKAVEEKVENHENVLMGLLNFLVKKDKYKEVASVSTRLIKSNPTKKESKEKERERERSRERARNGSQERRTARQVSERPEERKIRRREKSSEERSKDKRQTARYDIKGRQSYHYKDLERRH